MRIQTLQHDGFGPESAVPLTLAEGWTVIYAPNEAGKSSLLRAIRAALFDRVPAKADNARQPARGATVEAVLRARDGRGVRVFRTLDADKRKKARAKFTSSLEIDGAVAEEAAYEDLLGLPPSVAERLLTVAHEDLISGADRLGRLDDLFEIDSLQRLANVRDRVGKQLDVLRPKNSKVSKSPFNVAVREIVKADEELQTAVMTPEHHRELIRTRQQKWAEAEGSERAANAAGVRAARCAALVKAVPLAAERQALRRQAGELAITQPLPPQRAGEVLADCEERRRLAEAVRQRRQERQQAEAELAELAEDSPLDGLAAEIRRLSDGRDRAEAWRESVHECETRAEAAHRELESLPDVPELAGGAAALVERVEEWQAAIDAAAKELEKAEQAQSHAAIALAELQPDAADAEPDPVSPLVEAAAKALQDAPPPDDVRRRQGELDRQADDLQARWRALAARAGWDQWPDTRPASLPTVALAEDVRQSEQDARAELRDAENAARRAAKAVREDEAKLEDAAAAGTSATPQDRDEARAARDEAIRAARTAGDLTAALNEVETLSERADSIADALFENATHVAQVANLTTQLERRRRDLDAANAELQAAEARVSNASRPLEERWQAGDARPLSAAETLEWLAEEAELTGQQSELHSRLADVEQDIAAVDTAEAAAAEAATAAGVAPADLRAWVREQAEIRTREAILRQEAASRVPGAKKALAIAEESVSRRGDTLAKATAAMTAGLVAAGLGGDLSARAAKRTAETAAQAAGLRTTITDATEAAEAAARRAAEFEADVARVLEQLAADERTQALRTLEEAIDAERRRVGERAAWMRQQAAVEKAIAAEENVAAQLAEVEARLPDPASVEVADLEAVRQLAESSQALHQLRGREAELTKQIASLAVGPLGAFKADLEQADLELAVEDWRSEEAEAAAEQAAEADAARLARDQASEITGQLQSESTDTQSATVAGILEAARTDLREAVDRYAPLQILATLLERAGDHTRDAGADLLDGVGRLLGDVTEGRHTGVDRDKHDRLTVRGRDGSRSPAELSDGTRDLLYLAVRLEFARRRAASTPLPLLLDDVLVRVSEDRQPAVLRTLAKLGRQMQVVLLTCQKQTADLAAALPEDDRPVIADLT